MFRVRVLATLEEFALIAKAARRQGLSVSQFVTRVAGDLSTEAQSLQDQGAWRNISRTNKAAASKAEVLSIDNRYRTVVSATIRKS